MTDTPKGLGEKSPLGFMSPDQMEGRIRELEAQLAKVTAERDSNKAMINCAYLAGYYQSECGLPEHDHVKPEVEKTLGRAYRIGLEDAADAAKNSGPAFEYKAAATTIRAIPTPTDLVDRAMKEAE